MAGPMRRSSSFRSALRPGGWRVEASEGRIILSRAARWSLLMSTEALKSPAPADGSLKAQADAFWRGRSLRERQALGAGAIALIAVLIWLTLVQPAWRTLREAPAQLDDIDRQLQQMRLTANEVTALASGRAGLRGAGRRCFEGGNRPPRQERQAVAARRPRIDDAHRRDSDDFYDWLTDIRSCGALRARSKPAFRARRRDTAARSS